MAAVLRLESSGELSSTWVSLLHQSTLMGYLGMQDISLQHTFYLLFMLLWQLLTG